MKSRKRLSNDQAVFLGLPLNKKPKVGNAMYSIDESQVEKLEGFDQGSETAPNDYKEKPFVLSAWHSEGYMMDINEYCKRYKLPRKDISSYKLISHTGTPFYNIVFKENEEEISGFDDTRLDSIIAKYIKPVTASVDAPFLDTDYVDRAILTDVHVGMETNENGHSLYGGKWNKEEQLKRINHFCDEVLRAKKGNVLVVDDLGDYLDGWNAETTRGGHKLPQNMDNETAFDVGLDLKIVMLERLAPFYKGITFNNICNDNHSAAFGYVLNSAFKKIAEAKFDHVEVVNHRKFINHYFVGSHCFVITHGKDSKALKFGFKPFLDPKQMETIDSYLKTNGIYQDAKFIHFCKGDSHQSVFDQTTSEDYNYNNYPAFSPSSEWVQTNFKKGRSGFVIEHVDILRETINRSHHWFAWTK